jgi:hypothetical protein
MTALLLLLKPHAVLIGSCVMLAAGSFWIGYDLGKPKTPLTVQQAQQQVKLMHDTVSKTDTLVKLKTKILAHTDTTYQQVRDTVLRYIHDTTVVKQFVQACDSLKSSCDAFRTAAQSKFHADSGLVAALTQENVAWKASRPSRLHTVATTMLYAAVGFGLCKAAPSIPFLH